MKTLRICFLILTMAFAGPVTNAVNYAGFVNPFIGTDGHGHTFPAATYPFGMVQAGPDTRTLGWDGCSGYHYSDSTILGFTHTHLSGTGCLDCGDILFMPVVDEEVKSPFSHKNETATPGYYRVFLDHQKVNVRIAAGKRCAMHEYTYTAPGAKKVVIDLYHRDRLLGSSIEVVNNTTVRGWRQSTSWAKFHDVYFYAEFSEPFTGVDKVDSARLTLAFDPSSRSPIKVKVALSSVSCENAKENLLSEIPYGNWDFNSINKFSNRRRITVSTCNAACRRCRTSRTDMHQIGSTRNDKRGIEVAASSATAGAAAVDFLASAAPAARAAAANEQELGFRPTGQCQRVHRLRRGELEHDVAHALLSRRPDDLGILVANRRAAEVDGLGAGDRG